MLIIFIFNQLIAKVILLLFFISNTVYSYIIQAGYTCA